MGDFKRMSKCLLFVCFAACASVATSDSKCTKKLASWSEVPPGSCDTNGSNDGDKSYSNVTKKVTRAAMTGTVKSVMRSMSSCSGDLTITGYSDAACKTKAAVPNNPQQMSAAQIKLASCKKATSYYKNLAANGLTNIYEITTCSSSGASSVVPAAAAGALALVAMWFT